MKYAIIGDIHSGVQKNNPIFHKTLLDYGKWVRNICNEQNIDDLILLGDIFDSRTSITLETLDNVTQFFKIFYDFDIDAVVGNHDCMYNDSCKVNSLAPFADHPNIHIHDEICTKNNLTFCPWACKLEDIPINDYIFGHFDIVGYELTKGKISNHGFKGVDLMKKAKKAVFSGHYHIFQKRIYDGKPLIYTGSAYSLSFNDADSKKYLHIFDSETGEIQQIENTVSPCFKYVRSDKDLTDIKGNFISVVSDDQNLLEKVNMSQPLSVRKEIVDEFKKIDEKQEEVKEFKVVDIADAIEDFSLKLSDEWDLDDDLKKEVAKRTVGLYNGLK